MARDQNTFNKRQREAEKRRKADDKRKRRDERKRSPQTVPETLPPADDDVTIPAP